jgi:ADP-ribose pyrophosphatase
MPENEVTGSRRVFDGRALSLRVDTVTTQDGRQTTREIVEHASVIVAVPVEGDDIILVRQYRDAVAEDLLELPAGGIDPGETPEAAVRRELAEEIGYQPQRLTRLGGFYSAPGFCTEYLYLYLATDLIPKRLHAEDTDAISVVRVNRAAIPGLIQRGEIRDAKSIAGLLQYLNCAAD